MRLFSGFAALVKDLDSLPLTGWIFVERDKVVQCSDFLKNADYYIAETELEEISLEKTKKSFIECPTLVDVVSILDQRSLQPGLDDYIGAVIYYREHDDFLD